MAGCGPLLPTAALQQSRSAIWGTPGVTAASSARRHFTQSGSRRLRLGKCAITPSNGSRPHRDGCQGWREEPARTLRVSSLRPERDATNNECAMPRFAIVPAGSWPRRMRAEIAAGYCGEPTVEAFLKRVGSEYPQPRIKEGRRRLWLRDDLDRAIVPGDLAEDL
jgi:hypothetical protein